MLLLAQLGNLRDLFGRQFELEQAVHVALESLLLRAGGDDGDILVQTPPERNVAFGDAVLLGQLGVDVVDGAGARRGDGRQRRVRGDDDAVLAAEADEVAVLEVRVVLDLVDDGFDLGRLEEDLQVVLLEVGHADRLHLSGG